MDQTKTMLQAIIHGQNALKQGLEKKIDQVRGEVKELREELRDLDKRHTDRLDKIGKAVAYLEDDAPTREELDVLEGRVDNMERTHI